MTYGLTYGRKAVLRYTLDTARAEVQFWAEWGPERRDMIARAAWRVSMCNWVLTPEGKKHD